ncbi:MAG TPA: ATP-binding protein [Desulfomonilaceae bacterium]|nr:ATP-binding protein [Desulfomonilaceae bacterium]
MSRRKTSEKIDVDAGTVPETATDREALTVLVVGGEEALDEYEHISDSLSPMGLETILLGVVVEGWPPGAARSAMDSKIPVFDNYKKALKYRAPDLLIMTSEDPQLRKRLLRMTPPQTRIIDSFVLRAFRTLRMVSGQLGTTQTKLETVELIKEALMANADISIMQVDEDFKVKEISNDILQRTKMKRKDCLGRSCHWVIHRRIEPCHHEGYECALMDVLATGRVTHSVREEARPDGNPRYSTISWYPLKEDERGKKGVLIIWKDVTRSLDRVLDRQARNIRENVSQLVHEDRMIALGKLAAAAVHEINNPIQGILTFSKLMRSSLDGQTVSADDMEKFRSYLDLISSESARCGQILRNLLSFARQSSLRKSAFDLKVVMNEITLLVGNRMELQGITLEQQIDDDLPPIYSDRDQIKQALLNLILNAVEAMPNGGMIHVSAGSNRPGNKVRIRVSDTGGGIPKEVQRRIFEPFVTTKEDGKGVGLGLSVVYGIVSQHGGTIEVDSEEGKGATFTLNLPLDAANVEKAL